jgi:phospholipase/carboxylesterase
MLDTELIEARQDAGPRLMIVLHGLGDSMEGYRWLPEALQFPWLTYLLVNAPDQYYGGFSWYDLYNDPGPGIERSRRMLFELLDNTRERKFPTDKTMLLGFSQGCLMSLEIGARYPHRLAGIVGISGYAHEPAKLALELSPKARQQRFLVTHGTQDPLIPIGQVRPQIELLTRAGLKIKWHEFVKAHTIAGEQELAVIRDFVHECYVL